MFNPRDREPLAPSLVPYPAEDQAWWAQTRDAPHPQKEVAMGQPAESKSRWLPFALGAIVVLGVGVGLFLVTSKSGPSSAAEEATGGATGAVAVIVALCAVAAVRRRNER